MRRPTRKDLVLALVGAERVLRMLASAWWLLPGWARLYLRAWADALAEMVARERGPEPPK